MKINNEIRAQGPQQIYAKLATRYNIGVVPAGDGIPARAAITLSFEDGQRAMLTLDRQEMFHLMSALCHVAVKYSDELQFEPEEFCNGE